MLKRFSVGIFLLVGLVTVAYAADENQNACKGDPDQWRQLFDGKDLNGWKHVGPGGIRWKMDLFTPTAEWDCSTGRAARSATA